MPLTAFQSETLRLLAARRSPESFLAGGTVLNAGLDSPRYSRDYLDVLYFHQRHLSLGALCWAAAGKDPGVNPFMILQECQRTTHFRPEQFNDLHLAAPLDLQQWKQAWIEGSREAQLSLRRLPAEEVGCLYLDSNGKPVTPEPASAEFPALRRHFGSVRGAWPVIRE